MTYASSLHCALRLAEGNVTAHSSGSTLTASAIHKRSSGRASRIPSFIRRRIRPIRLCNIQILQPRQMGEPLLLRWLIDRRRAGHILVRQSFGLFSFGFSPVVGWLHVGLRYAAVRKTVGCFPAPIVRPRMHPCQTWRVTWSLHSNAASCSAYKSWCDSLRPSMPCSSSVVPLSAHSVCSASSSNSPK